MFAKPVPAILQMFCCHGFRDHDGGAGRADDHERVLASYVRANANGLYPVVVRRGCDCDAPRHVHADVGGR